jgi:hypothetical protein
MYIKNNGGEYRDWYVDVCSSIRRKLSDEDKAKHLVISRRAYSSYVAAEVQDYFNRLGTNGHIAADTGNADIVYAYRRSVGDKEEPFQANDVSGEKAR